MKSDGWRATIHRSSFIIIQMPIIRSTYRAPLKYFNTHINTIGAAVFRPIFPLAYRRERLELPDGDFVDIDWSEVSSEQLMISLHGLEGNARRPYMAGMMKYFNEQGWDALGLNMRGCSGEDNRLLEGYHSGKSDDLAFIIQNIIARQKYKRIVLVGFSIGGNIVLKYLGEQGEATPSVISHAVAFSTPVDLVGCSLAFETATNWLYLTQFLITLKKKAQAKAEKFPNQFDLQAVLKARTFRAFDNAYTAPVNGFIDAMDYWTRVSSIHFIEKITIPFLLVNAADDTFLSPTCFPFELAERIAHFYLEIPRLGGHLGFMKPREDGFLWSEKRAWSFLHDETILNRAQIVAPKMQSTFLVTVKK